VLVGALAAYALAAQVQVAVLLAFAAGNLLYIALADLVPELTTSPAP
jgi:zinc and cadmium transporter